MLDLVPGIGTELEKEVRQERNRASGPPNQEKNMNARIFAVIGLSAAVWAGAHESAPREIREDRDHRPVRVLVEEGPDHRGFDRDRFHHDEDRREAWGHEHWRRERFEEHRYPAPVVLVEDCHRREPDRVVVVSDPAPVRGTVSIHW